MFPLIADALSLMRLTIRHHVQCSSPRSTQFQVPTLSTNQKLMTGREKSIGQYIKLDVEIGTGTTATVWKGYHREEKFDVAIKIIDTSKLSTKAKQCIEGEITSLKNLAHPNLIQMFNVYRKNERIYIITEYCEGGDLRSYLQSHQLSEKETLPFLINIVKGLHFLHKRNHVHRDMKPGNILISRGKCKIADFGCTRFIDQDEMATTICGTPAYISPEILLGSSYNTKVDIWSLGVLWYEMVYHKLPFVVDKDARNILTETIAYPEDVLSDLGLDLLKSMLERDPKKRIDIQQIVEHPYLDLKGDQDILSETLMLVDQYDFIQVEEIDGEVENAGPTPWGCLVC